MKSQVIIVALVALGAGLIGGFLGSSMGHGETPACASEAAPATAPRPVEEELMIIDARGDWGLREALTNLVPVTLQIGSETLVSSLDISWKPGKKFEARYVFYKYVSGKL